MSPNAPETTSATPDLPSGLAPGSLTLRQTADALSTSTTTLRKMIRQGRLPEAEKVRTVDGRVWAIPADAIPGIAERAGFTVSVTESIDLRDPEMDEVDVPEAPHEELEVLVDPSQLDQLAAGVEAEDNTIDLDAHRLESWRFEPVPSEARSDVIEPPAPVTPLTVPEPQPEPEVAGTALETIGAEVEEAESGSGGDSAPTLAEVLDTALLEKLLGAKEAETEALVKAERQRTEYEALAARQLEVEQWYADADSQRAELAAQLQNETLARAISDARVTELRDQLQREITYAEAERYERRQALARETRAAAEAAETRAALGWWARRRLRRMTQ